VLDDHAGSELCGFDAAHDLYDRSAVNVSLKSLLISEIPAGSPLCDAVHAE
jgi:hypothetical protein